MAPKLRKIGLTVHIVFSVGWFGAIIPYLTLAIFGLVSDDPERIRATYFFMKMIGWSAIVPLSLGALVTGLIQSLGTSVGLFRQWWVVAKFMLTTIAILVLLRHMEAIGRMADIAATTSLPEAGSRTLQIQLALHAAGGLGVLLLATILSVFKPWGLTGLGRRKMPSNISSPRAIQKPSPSIRNPEPMWVRVVGIHVLGLVMLGAIVHLFNGGMPHH